MIWGGFFNDNRCFGPVSVLGDFIVGEVSMSGLPSEDELQDEVLLVEVRDVIRVFGLLLNGLGFLVIGILGV